MKPSHPWHFFIVPALSASIMVAVAYLSLVPSPLTPVDLFLCWEPQAQFTGYYVAAELGMFQDAGVKVSFRHDLGIGESLTEVVKRDDAFLATQLVNVLAWLGNSPKVDVFGIVTAGCNLGWATNGPKVALPDVLAHEQLQSWWGPQDLMLRAFLRSRALPVDDLAKRVRAGVSAEASAEKVGVLAMRYNELLDSAQFLGQKTEFVSYCDLDFPIFEDALVGHAAGTPADRDLQKRLATAVWRGWDYALQHPDRALDIVMKQNPRKPRSHQARQLKTFLASLMPKGAAAPQFKRTFATMRTMIDIGLFKNAPAVQSLVDQLEHAPSLRSFAETEPP